MVISLVHYLIPSYIKLIKFPLPEDVIVDTFDHNDLKVEARDQKFKASLQYIANLGPAQATKSPTSKISKQITPMLVQVTQIKFNRSLKNKTKHEIRRRAW